MNEIIAVENPTETITTVHTYDQPIETSVKVAIEVDSKGQRKPTVEIKISRKLAGVNAKALAEDIEAALIKCKETLNKALEV